MNNTSDFISEDHLDDQSFDQTPIELSTFISAIFMLIMSAFGVYSNILSIVVFFHSIMRSPINILLGSLSLIDLLLVCLVVPVFVIPALNIFINSPLLTSFYSITLLYIYPLNMFVQTCSVWTFVLVSLERFSAVVRPLKITHKLVTCSEARRAEMMIVVIAFCYNVIRFWEYESSQMTPGFQRLLRNSHFYYIFYCTVLYVLTHFFVPFFIILILNACILRSLRRSHVQRRMMSRNQIQQRRTSAMIVLVTFMFVFCNFLPFLINIWEALDPELFYGDQMKIAYILLDISNLLIVLNSSSTAIVYLVYCKKYRAMFRHFAALSCFRPGHHLRLSQIGTDHLGKGIMHAHVPAALPLLMCNPVRKKLKNATP